MIYSLITNSAIAAATSSAAPALPHLRLDCSRQINLIVIHCTASRCDRPLIPSQLEAEHRRRGFACCGYHFYITRNGTIHSMRPLDRIGAHALGFNKCSIGIAYEGGLTPAGNPADTRTPEQCEALRVLLRQLLMLYPRATVCGHRDLSPDLNGNGIIEPCEYIKQCPCFDATSEYAPLCAEAFHRLQTDNRT